MLENSHPVSLRSQTAIERARYVEVNALVVRHVASRGKFDEHHFIMGRIHGKWEGKKRRGRERLFERMNATKSCRLYSIDSPYPLMAAESTVLIAEILGSAPRAATP